MNQVSLIGRLGRDPELRYTTAGKAVTTFSIAIDSGWGESKTTDWIDIVCWDKTAETVAQHLRKGSQVGVEGRIKTRTYEGKDGTRKKATEVVTTRVHFLGTRAKQDEQSAPDPWGDEPPF